MRKITYVGFLEKYICELSGIRTTSVSKNIKLISVYPRILEPLALYAVLTNTSENIIKKNAALLDEYNLIKSYNGEYDRLPGVYQKVYKSYIYASSQKKRDDDTKKLMHKQICLLLDKKMVSNYKLAKELGIDISNCNSFIKNCNCDRLSKLDVERIWRYLSEA